MKNKRGQGLVEYLILVCLIAVSAIAVVTTVSTNIKEQFANVSAALRGTAGVKLTTPTAADYKRRGFNDFNENSAGHASSWGL